MNAMLMYPRKCRKNISRVMNATGVSIETAYAMILMTAALMDLYPEDEQVADMVLEDCGISHECA